MEKIPYYSGQKVTASFKKEREKKKVNTHLRENENLPIWRAPALRQKL